MLTGLKKAIPVKNAGPSPLVLIETEKTENAGPTYPSHPEHQGRRLLLSPMPQWSTLMSRTSHLSLAGLGPGPLPGLALT